MVLNHSRMFSSLRPTIWRKNRVPSSLVATCSRVRESGPKFWAKKKPFGPVCDVTWHAITRKPPGDRSRAGDASMEPTTDAVPLSVRKRRPIARKTTAFNRANAPQGIPAVPRPNRRRHRVGRTRKPHPSCNQIVATPRGGRSAAGGSPAKHRPKS